MTSPDGGFPQAAARFSAEVDAALTRARRAAREARALSTEFRRSTDELAEQAKTGKLRGVRRDAVVPTAAEPREHAVNFRSANGLPVEDLPGADELIARLPAPEPPPKVDDEDFSQHQVLFDIDIDDDTDVDTDVDGDVGEPAAGSDPPRDDATHAGDAEEDFSQQRILDDAMVESYRPDGMLDAVFEPSEQEIPSSDATSKRRPEVDG